MKKIYILLVLLSLGLFISCEKDESSKAHSFTGKAQKGPYIQGTTITVHELKPDLGQTGQSFTTSVTDDDGSFSLSNIDMNSNLALLTATGYYFSEVYDRVSGAPLTLQALTDLAGKDQVNINVLTHLIKGRIEKLVAGGLNFQQANEQAKSEMLSFLGVTGTFENDFDNLDISAAEEYNAVLLAFSILLQRRSFNYLDQASTSTPELTQLLSRLSADFAEDGLISDQKSIDTLLYNISQLNLIDMRNIVKNRYSSLGQSVTISDFEKYIIKFLEKHGDNYMSFAYPETAIVMLGSHNKFPNILVPSETVFYSDTIYSIAAITPLNKSLKIKFTGSSYIQLGHSFGWELTNEYPDGFTLESQRQSSLMTVQIAFTLPGTAIIEYYENSDTPTFSKEIGWQKIGD
jgi:hypothetical protein